MNWFVIFGIVLGGYLFLCFLVWLIQGVFLFHPEVLPEDFEFKYDFPWEFEEVKLVMGDDELLDGLLFSKKENQKVVYYVKGNTRSIKGWGKFSRDFVPKGWDMFMIDFPGFGKSTGEKTEKSIGDFLQKGYEWLKTKYPEKDIVIYSRSLGSGFGAQIAFKNNPRLLVLDSPYYSFDHLAQYYAFLFPAKWLIRFHLPVYKYLKACCCKVHIIHGKRDLTIPYIFSRWLKNSNKKKVTLYSIRNGSHNNLPSLDSYHDALEIILNERPPKLFTFNPQKGDYLSIK